MSLFCNQRSVWGEWTSPEFSAVVKVVRGDKRMGVAGAKDFGAKQTTTEVSELDLRVRGLIRVVIFLVIV